MTAAVEPFAVNHSLQDVLRKANVTIRSVHRYGPTGLAMRLHMPDGRDGSLIVTQADDDGREWIHASIAFDTDPTYADLQLLHHAVYGRRRFAYQQFVPHTDHVNQHEHALHLWGRADGKPVLPYAKDGTV
jgi:hypothetical protein